MTTDATVKDYMTAEIAQVYAPTEAELDHALTKVWADYPAEDSAGMIDDALWQIHASHRAWEIAFRWSGTTLYDFAADGGNYKRSQSADAIAEFYFIARDGAAVVNPDVLPAPLAGYNVSVAKLIDPTERLVEEGYF